MFEEEENHKGWRRMKSVKVLRKPEMTEEKIIKRIVKLVKVERKSTE